MLIYVYIEFSNYEVSVVKRIDVLLIPSALTHTHDPNRSTSINFFTFNVLHCCLFCHVLSDVVDVNSHTQAVAKGGLGAKRSLFC